MNFSAKLIVNFYSYAPEIVKGVSTGAFRVSNTNVISSGSACPVGIRDWF